MNKPFVNKPPVNRPAKQVNIYEAKTQLSRLVDRASKGETIVIARSGIPLARLVPLAEKKQKIKFGLMKGKIKLAPDFDAPLPDWLLDAFEGKLAEEVSK